MMPKFSLRFTVDGTTQTITREDNIKIRAGSKNYWYAGFTLDSATFQGMDYLSATFSNEPYELNRGRAKIIPLEPAPKDRDNPDIVMECQIPWEVMTRKGKVYVGIFAGDMLVTNEAEIEVTFAAPTMGGNSEPSPSWYSVFEDQLAGKVDKVHGKGLSANDYDNEAKAKVDAIPENPQYTDTTYTAGAGINISEENVISAIGGSGAGTLYITTNTEFPVIKEAVDNGLTVILKSGEPNDFSLVPLMYYNYDDLHGEGNAIFADDAPDEWAKAEYLCTYRSETTTWEESFIEGAFVSVHEQSWTEPAKAQARANIGAGTYSKPSGGIPAADLASGVIPAVPDAATSAPADLASSAAVGSSTKYAREDHKHKLPSASDVGALPSDTTYVSSVNGQSGAVSLTIPEKLVVTYTLSAQTSGSSATCDKTYAEIAAALQAKTPIEAYAVYGGYVIGELTTVVFSGTAVAMSMTLLDTTDSKITGARILHTANGITYEEVTHQPSSTAPNMDGTASAGSSTDYARGDHTHPRDTSKSGVIKYTTLTLATTDWESSGNAYACSKTVTGMTATSIVWLSYSDTSTEFTEAQSANTLTFGVAAIPSAAVTVDVAFVEGGALS